MIEQVDGVGLQRGEGWADSGKEQTGVSGSWGEMLQDGEEEE